MEGSAVAVRGAYKRYSPNAVVLRGLDLTVPEATIYGLLGPSGCGKTTLLRSLVGMVQLDSGSIRVKAQTKNNVGYMPQELGLYEYMTIMEAFQFYGKLYSMEKENVDIRGKELIDFLELPNSKRLIGTLSGGQQRRLSFAVTLIHDPDLLILDEPTVGIDPVLSAAIWERLIEMTACQRKTIIITTHYIEEAKQAHTIGLMRDGVLLAEQSPSSLMVAQDCDTLEEAFLLLSKKQEDSRPDNESLVASYPEKQKCTSPLTDPCPYWKSNRFLVQLKKNTYWTFRNFGSTLFLLLLPAVTGLMCQIILSQKPSDNRAIGIFSPELTEGMKTCTSRQYKGCRDDSRPFTCALMDLLQDSTLTTVIYDDLAAGKDAVRRNEVWGVLSFSQNYTGSLIDRIDYDFLSTPTSIIEFSSVTAYMDMSNLWISTFLNREIYKDVRHMIETFLTDCDLNPKLLEIPIQMNPAVFGDNEPTFLEFFTPGVVCTFAFYLAIMYTTGAIMFEKSVGLERSLVAGMTKLELVAAHSVIQMAIAAIQELTTLAVFYYFFPNTMIGNIFLVFLLLMMLQVMGLFYGLILGLGLTYEGDATNAGTGTVNALFMLAGLMWPVEGMHKILRSIIWAIPVQPAVEAYRAITMRDWGITHPTVLKGFLSTTVWTGIFILGSIALCRGKKTSL